MSRRQKQPRLAEVTELAAEGYGLTEDQRFGVYGLLPGERATIYPRRKKKGRWLATHDARENAHPDRVTPACAHADICGGCALQHFDHGSQIAFKEARLARLFAPFKPGVFLSALHGSPDAYRSKARLGVKYVIKRDEVLVGFREKASPFVADMSDCSVLDQRLAALIAPLKLMLSSLTVKAAIPQIEVAASEDMVVLVVRHLEALLSEDVNILGQFSSKHGIRIMTQAAGPDSVIPLPGEAPAVLSYSLRGEGLVFEFEPLDFTQVNFSMNEQMTNQALDLLNLQADDQVIDAFCGIGNFTLPIAKRVTSVLGLESAEASVQRAQKNAKKNAVSNALFEVQDLYAKEGVPDLLGYNKMLIDPPRSGAEQLVQSPLIDRLERIVYVSCYPETLARDAEYLVKRGFRVDAVGLIDMFPHTAHLESMALFVREGSNG